MTEEISEVPEAPSDHQPKISKNVLVMGLVSFFNDLSSEMIYPLVPIFLTSVLGAPITVVGLIEGIAESTSSVLKVIFGWISDKLQKRKPIVLIGYLFSAFSKILLGLSYVWPLVLLARFTDRAGKGIRTSARDALIAESSTPMNRGISFGFHRALDTLGAVIGPLFAILFIKALDNNFHWVFYLASIPGFIGVFLLIHFVKEKRKEPLEDPISILKLNNFNFTFKVFVLISCVFAIGNSSDAFLILRAQNLGLSVILVILAYTAFNFSYAIFSTPAGILSDKIGPRKVILIGFLLFSFVYLCFGIIQQDLFLWVLFPIYGVYMALTEGISKAYISNLVPQENLGVAFGVYQTATGICTLFSSIIAGLLWTHINVQAPFVFGSLMAFLAWIAFLSMKRSNDKLA